MKINDSIPLRKTDISVWELIKKQYMFKLKIHLNLFGGIVLIMLAASLAMISGNTHFIDNGYITIRLNEVTSDMIIMLYVIMIFIVSIKLTGKKRQIEMFTMPTSKWTNHFTNGLLLVSLSVVISVIAYFVHYAVFLGHYVINGPSNNVVFIERLTISGLILAIVVTFFYMLFISLLGYFIGETVQFSKIFVIVWIIIGIILLNLAENTGGALGYVMEFYTAESRIGIFLLKVIPSILILFLLTSVINRTKGVRD